MKFFIKIAIYKSNYIQQEKSLFLNIRYDIISIKNYFAII